METKILIWIQENMRAEWLTPIMVAVTHIGFFIWIVFSLVFLINKNTRKLGIIASTSIVYNLIIVNLILKNFIGRIRPYEVIEKLTILVGEQSDKSFPSGHTSIAFAFVSVTWFLLPKKYSVPMTVFASLIAFTRMYIGVHYPTDILGGIAAGILCGCLAIFTFNYIENKINSKKELM